VRNTIGHDRRCRTTDREAPAVAGCCLCSRCRGVCEESWAAGDAEGSDRSSGWIRGTSSLCPIAVTAPGNTDLWVTTRTELDSNDELQGGGGGRGGGRRRGLERIGRTAATPLDNLRENLTGGRVKGNDRAAGTSRLACAAAESNVTPPLMRPGSRASVRQSVVAGQAASITGVSASSSLVLPRCGSYARQVIRSTSNRSPRPPRHSPTSPDRTALQRSASAEAWPRHRQERV